MGRTAEVGHRLSEDWASLGLGKALSVVGELEPLSNPSFPSDRRKTVGLGLLWL